MFKSSTLSVRVDTNLNSRLRANTRLDHWDDHYKGGKSDICELIHISPVVMSSCYGGEPCAHDLVGDIAMISTRMPKLASNITKV